jgi:hypothetical protein
VNLYLFHTLHRGWLLRAESPDAAADLLLTYEPALGAEPEGVHPATYPGLTTQRGSLARKMIHVTLDGPPGRIYQWGM